MPTRVAALWAASVRVYVLIICAEEAIGFRLKGSCGVHLSMHLLKLPTGSWLLNAPNKTAARVGAEAVWLGGGSEP